MSDRAEEVAREVVEKMALDPDSRDRVYVEVALRRYAAERLRARVVEMESIFHVDARRDGVPLAEAHRIAGNNVAVKNIASWLRAAADEEEGK